MSPTNSKTYKLTNLALLCTLSIGIYFAESLLPPLAPIPGIKLGLANIITLIVLNLYSGREAFVVLLVRILLCSILFGQGISLFYSLTGGILCLICMYFINMLLQKKAIYVTSIIGAIAHNIGQLLVAFFITSTVGIFTYLPFLMLSAIITGLFTGMCAYFSQKLINKAAAQTN